MKRQNNIKISNEETEKTDYFKYCFKTTTHHKYKCYDSVNSVLVTAHTHKHDVLLKLTTGRRLILYHILIMIILFIDISPRSKLPRIITLSPKQCLCIQTYSVSFKYTTWSFKRIQSEIFITLLLYLFIFCYITLFSAAYEIHHKDNNNRLKHLQIIEAYHVVPNCDMVLIIPLPRNQ